MDKVQLIDSNGIKFCSLVKGDYKGFVPDNQQRGWLVLVYDESEDYGPFTGSDIITHLLELKPDWFIFGVKHDRDVFQLSDFKKNPSPDDLALLNTPKKVHYHLFVSGKNGSGVRLLTLLRALNDLDGVLFRFEFVRPSSEGAEACARYFLHSDKKSISKNKYRYDLSDVFGSNDGIDYVAMKTSDAPKKIDDGIIALFNLFDSIDSRITLIDAFRLAAYNGLGNIWLRLGDRARLDLINSVNSRV